MSNKAIITEVKIENLDSEEITPADIISKGVIMADIEELLNSNS